MNIAKNICALLCEDIREEKGGKLSFLGVFGIENCGIVLDKIPALLPRICLALMLSGTSTDIKSCEATITLPGEPPMKMQYPIAQLIKKGQNITLGITVSPCRVDSVGQGLFELRFNNKKKPEYIFNFNVTEKSTDKGTENC